MKNFKRLQFRYIVTPFVIGGLLLAGVFVFLFGMTSYGIAKRADGIIEQTIQSNQICVEDSVFSKGIAMSFVKNENGIAFKKTDKYFENLSDKLVETALVSVKEKAFVLDKYKFKMNSKEIVIDGKACVAFAIYDYTPEYDLLYELSQVSVMSYFLSLIILGICCYIMSVNAIRPLKDAYFKQRQLIADASHEIKTPITVVSANLELIASDPTASVESNKRWIDSSQYQIKRMSSLILQMLELSSIEEGKYFKNYEKINASQICFGVVLSFEAVAFEKNIDIKSDIQDGLIAKGNSIEFEKLVTTLLDNALKYTNSNGIITFELRKEGKKIVMSVVNTGEGISAEKIPYLFERFYKMDNAHQESGNSFGLGLSIAKTIAVNMKGDIECTSEVGKWTKFEVVLPYEREKARAKKQINSDEV